MTLRTRSLIATALVAALAAAALMLAVVNAPRGQAAVAPVDADGVAAQAALNRLTRTDRIAQLIMTSVPGATLSARDAKVLGAARFGGVIVFGANYRSRAQLARFTKSVDASIVGGSLTAPSSRPHVLVSVDQEGGSVKRLPDAAPFRSAQQLGRLNKPASTRAQAKLAAATLKSVGIQMDLAPVADRDITPAHVMRGRSFGSAPELVGVHVDAFVRGLHAGGGLATVKHFPGFGGASMNSDDGIAEVTRTRAQLLAGDLGPFLAAIDAGVDAVMIAHARYTAIDKLRPGSASPTVYKMLRKDAHFDGVAITDSLNAPGFTTAAHTTVANGCARVIAAGADMALITGTLADAVHCRAALVVAANKSAVLRARIDQAAMRVLRLKAHAGLLPGA
jgi:beta-N-acetylhexosaminidase